MSRIKGKGDFVFGAAAIVVMIAFWTQTYKLSGSVRLMPRVIIVLAIISSLVIMVKTVLRKETGNGDGEQKKKSGKQAAVGAGIFLFIILLMALAEVIGMYVCLYLSLAAISVSISVIKDGWNWKKILGELLYNLVVICVIYVLFHVLLKVNTPAGILI